MITFRGMRGRMGGKLANIVSLVTVYLLNMCWFVCFAIVVILCFVYYMFTFLCSSISFNNSDCLDFSLFQPFIREMYTGVSLLHFFNKYHFPSLIKPSVNFSAKMKSKFLRGFLITFLVYHLKFF